MQLEYEVHMQYVQYVMLRFASGINILLVMVFICINSLERVLDFVTLVRYNSYLQY